MALLGRRETTLRESLEDVIEEHSDDTSQLTAEERIMLMNIINLRELEIDDVMVPRADIVAVDMSLSFDELMTAFKEAAHSRMPIYNDTLDDITGMVHIKDVLRVLGDPDREGNPPSVSDIKRRVLFVPPSMPVVDLLLRMRLSRIHMALVIDEYGGTDGLVTIEDLIEQIVGEIEDEHDEQLTPLIVSRPGGGYDVDARCPVEDLESRVNVDLLPPDREEYVDTVGGLVFSLAGRVPVRGEIIDHPGGLEFEIIDADARRLKRVRVRKRKPVAP
ncbi:MAG: hemolysin family protein [Alphaproteobacteria bacterium]